MSNFWGFLERIGRALQWWVIVSPWEAAIRVRTIPLARLFRRKSVRVVQLGAGIYPKIPIIDTVYKQSVRLRTTALPIQTLTTKDGHTLTTSGVLGYSVIDLLKLYETLHHPEDTLQNKATGAIAQYVQEHTRAECTPALVASGATGCLDLTAYGLRFEELLLADFAYVRTYRLISDHKWGKYGDGLSTTNPVSSAAS